MQHYVYIVRQGEMFIKVGVSHNIVKRIALMQTGNPYKLKLMTSFPFESRAEAFEMERLLHKKLASCNKRGEWFDYKKAKKMLKFNVGGHSIAFTTDFAWRAGALVP